MSPVQSQAEHEIQQAHTSRHFQFDWKWLGAILGIVLVVVGWNVLGGVKETKSADELVTLSQQHGQEGRYQQCIDTGLRALKVQPDMAVALNNVGWCYGKLGKWDDAIRNLREVARLAPQFELGSNNLAWALEQKSKGGLSPADEELKASHQHAQAGRYPKCIDSARKALTLNPSGAIAYNNIGWCSAKLGNWSEAYDNLREALRIQPALQIAENNRRWVVEEMAKKGIAGPR